jgi:flagellar basal-body rod modification protein FlgD
MTDNIEPASSVSVNQADYLKLFMQELTYQDPLKPIDNREFMAQMAQFSALQQAQETNQSLDKLLGMTSANQMLMMLGKQVKIKDSDALGIVRNIQFHDHSAPQLIIEINGGQVAKLPTEITDVF